MSAGYAAAAFTRLRDVRRRNAAGSPLIFAKTYLPSHFTQKMAGMHENLFETLAGITTQRGARIAFAAPRGHAKSTVGTLAYALWCLLYSFEHLIVIVSNTAEQASKLLGHLKHEIETNAVLRQDFHELQDIKRASPWRKDSILLPSGAMVLSYGIGQNLRGARNRQHRPTLIIADDLEDKEGVLYEEQRQKAADWFQGTLLKAGTPTTNVVVLGTILHHDSLLAHLVDPRLSPGWRQKRLRAVIRFSDRSDLWEQWGAVYRRERQFREHSGPGGALAFFEAHQREMLEGTRVLWPEAYPYYALMETRIREGQSAFSAELQNEPLDPSACIFAGAHLRYWDDEHPDERRLLAALGEGEFFGACDPSLGADPARGDYTAIVILFRPDGSEVKYVIAADLARRTPDQTIERIIQYARLYRFSGFGVESNQFQSLMVADLERRAKREGVRLPVESIQSRSAKQQRIAGLEVEVSQGFIQFSRRHQVLLEQLRSFPVGKHDDGPDALEMAVHIASDDGHSWSVCDFDGTCIYDSRYPNRRRPSKDDPMPDRL